MLCIALPALAAPKKKPPPPKPEPKPEDPAAPAAPTPAPTPTPTNAPMGGGGESKPWSQGVPQDKQDKAGALYEQGNQLFAQQAHAPALAKYKEAIALWEHPLIRFNMAVTEIRLERILDAADDLEKALRYGDKPFKPELYQQALDYQALLRGRVGFVEATCDQANARLLFDGKPWFDCPGTQKIRTLTGEHAIVGEKPDYLTASTKVVVEGGKTVSRKIALVPLDSGVVIKYRYRRWIPWTVTLLGLAVAGGGVGVWLIGKDEMDKFNADYAVQCANGCERDLTDPAHSALAAQRDSAILKGQVGIGVAAAGGAVAITGIILVIANRGERVRPNVEVAPKSGGGIAQISWRF
jgi:hypothetical protein